MHLPHIPPVTPKEARYQPIQKLRYPSIPSILRSTLLGIFLYLSDSSLAISSDSRPPRPPHFPKLPPSLPSPPQVPLIDFCQGHFLYEPIGIQEHCKQAMSVAIERCQNLFKGFSEAVSYFLSERALKNQDRCNTSSVGVTLASGQTAPSYYPQAKNAPYRPINNLTVLWEDPFWPIQPKVTNAIFCNQQAAISNWAMVSCDRVLHSNDLHHLLWAQVAHMHPLSPGDTQSLIKNMPWLAKSINRRYFNQSLAFTIKDLGYRIASVAEKYPFLYLFPNAKTYNFLGYWPKESVTLFADLMLLQTQQAQGPTPRQFMQDALLLRLRHANAEPSDIANVSSAYQDLVALIEAISKR